MNITFSLQEYVLIQQAVAYSQTECLKWVHHQYDNTVDLLMSEDDLIQIYESCENYLLFCGFDENYEPNAVGKDLEKVIDRIHNKLSV